ncbi:MAG: hypothetical protein HY428_01330 [Candidatus Levybacteria bacterium]|nr:hypothetical protein [Candidatus Levybacteria bacterium]
MPSHHFVFGKIVATPTDSAWSQAYHAGNLFAVLSLTHEGSDEERSLNVLGKAFFNTFEAEFFSLEEKTLTTIKEAIANAAKEIPLAVDVSFCVAYIKDHVLYLFLLGTGAVLMKRGEARGNLLEAKQQNQEEHSIMSASGYLQPSDVIVLKTKPFTALVSQEKLSEALGLSDVHEMTEALSPLVHGAEDGGATALFLSYSGKEEVREDEEEVLEGMKETPADAPSVAKAMDGKKATEGSPRGFTPRGKEETEVPREEKRRLALPSLPKFPHLRLGGFSHKRKVFLSIAIIILVVLAGSIYLTIQNAENSKTKALFNEVYPKAQKAYDEGMGLMTLNQSLAQDDLKKAKKTLEDNKDKFKSGSDERTRIDELLSKVNSQLSGEDDSTTMKSATEVSDDKSPLLAAAKKHAATAISQDEKNIYVLTDKEVLRIDKGSADKKSLIKNEDSWSDARGIAPFGSNLYVLDGKEGVIKFVAGSDGYGKNNYFTKDKPDLSQAANLAIDASVYILMKDGNVKKYTRGESESFSVNGLSKPFSSPTRVVTNADMDNIYVLDNGNNRIVKISKTGSVLGQYQASVLRDAKEIEIVEKDKKAYILQSNKIYVLSLE